MKKYLILLLLFSTTSIFSQDVIVKTDGTTIISKVYEIGITDVKYKKFSNINGPMYTISKSDIMTINFENGEKESFNDKIIEDKKTKDNNVSKEAGQDFLLEAGTNIPLQNVRHIRASELSKGQTVEFQVSRDVTINGITVIPYGTSVYGTVYKARLSSWWGTKGKLGITINKISMPNGIDIPLSEGDLYVTGKNRTALSVCLFLFALWPCCFITGSRAEIPANYPAVAKIANPVVFKKEGEVYVPKITKGVKNNINVPDKVHDVTKENVKESTTYFPYNAVIKNYFNESIKAIIIFEDDNNIIYKYESRPNGASHTIKKKYIKSIEKY